MQNAADAVFKALADPTRRAIFERLTREGFQTVHALTERAGVSQPMVSKAPVCTEACQAGAASPPWPRDPLQRPTRSSFSAR